MIESLLAISVGLVLLVWSADRFVTGSANIAIHYGMPPLLIGMLIVGFGTSAPEMLVSVSASMDGNSGIALGNAYGSNIVNIAVILSISALINPIKVQSSVLKKELPWLILVSGLSVILLRDFILSRWDAVILLLVFLGLMAWTISQGMKHSSDALVKNVNDSKMPDLTIKSGFFWLIFGLVILVLSAQILVWGAIRLAVHFGINDLVIGLTIVAIGTSLPELASSVVAARRGAHEIALGNVLGSNLFNTLAVVGLAGIIHPFSMDAEIIYRDMTVMILLTLLLFIFAYGFNKPGRINRIEGFFLLLLYLAYTIWLLNSL
ncbi:MAG: calcium/sodium antiporter [Proteobacteria bacterium]|nr:calcium/sodium antiporter [Pseudomonadota bacterium]